MPEHQTNNTTMKTLVTVIVSILMSVISAAGTAVYTAGRYSKDIENNTTRIANIEQRGLLREEKLTTMQIQDAVIGQQIASLTTAVDKLEAAVTKLNQELKRN